MSEDVARAVGSGAGSHLEFEINGKKCIPRALSLKELGEIERECLFEYKDQFMASYANGLRYMNLSNDERNAKIEKKIEEVSAWDISELPVKKAYNPASITVSKALQDRIFKKYHVLLDAQRERGAGDAVIDNTIRKLVATDLDNGTLTPEEYKQLTGSNAHAVEIGYANWWITATPGGQIEMAYVCFKHSGITKDELSQEIVKDPGKLIAASRTIEQLTQPQVGNT